MRGWLTAVATAGCCAVVAGGCASSNNSAADFAPGGGAAGSASGNNGGGAFVGASSSSGFGSSSGLPPEMKQETAFQSPVATGQVVWTANPTSGRVAYIDATSFDVKTVQAGDGPTYLAAVPDPVDDVAIVINALSQDATLLRDHQGVIATQTFPVPAGATSWSVSKSGRWAIAWTNTSLVANAAPTQGFQDVEVIDLSRPQADGGSAPRPATDLIVGFRPVQIVFAEPAPEAGPPTETRAFAVTQDGISVIDLVDGAQPQVIASYPLGGAARLSAPDAGGTLDAAASPDAPTGGSDAGDDGGANDDASSVDSSSGSSAGSPTTAPDVSITPDGSYALVRQDGVQSIAVISLADGTTTTVALPALPTDLTLSPRGDFALAVLRDTSAVVTLPIPAIAGNPMAFTSTTIGGELVGRAIITPDSARALLFTTVAPVSRMSVLNLDGSGTFRTIVLHGAVAAVFPTADGNDAIVLHDVTPAAGVEGAFSVVPVSGSLPANVVSLPAPPSAVAIDPDSARAIVSMSDTTKGIYGAYLVKMPSLQATGYTLASPPIAVGIVAGAGQAYAAQDYAEGRITFVDLQADGGAGGARTITGFELGAGIVEGSNP